METDSKQVTVPGTPQSVFSLSLWCYTYLPLLWTYQGLTYTYPSCGLTRG